MTFGRGARISKDFWPVVSNILGFGAWGAKNPRIFGMGCQISCSQMGVPVFLPVFLAWGCQISGGGY